MFDVVESGGWGSCVQRAGLYEAFLLRIVTCTLCSYASVRRVRTGVLMLQLTGFNSWSDSTRGSSRYSGDFDYNFHCDIEFAISGRAPGDLSPATCRTHCRT